MEREDKTEYMIGIASVVDFRQYIILYDTLQPARTVLRASDVLEQRPVQASVLLSSVAPRHTP
eukprot:6192479-Pleurochrysis_carterae.AAC.2